MLKACVEPVNNLGVYGHESKSLAEGEVESWISMHRYRDLRYDVFERCSQKLYNRSERADRSK